MSDMDLFSWPARCDLAARAVSHAHRLAIVGSRDYAKPTRVDVFARRFKEVVLGRQVVLVTGCARGIDAAAREAARRHGFGLKVYEADWEGLGKAAGFIRNGDIVQSSEAVVAFWDGKSRGTLDTIRKALAAERLVVVL